GQDSSKTPISPGPRTQETLLISSLAGQACPHRWSLMKSVLVLLAAFALAGPGLVLGQKPSSKKKDSQASLPPPAQVKQDAADDTTMESDDTIKLGTELVNVLFSVVDQNNRIVSNLNQNEVTVLDDGRPHKITA